MRKIGTLRTIRSTRRKPASRGLRAAETALGAKYLEQPNKPVTRAELAVVTLRTLKAIELEVQRMTLLGIAVRALAWARAQWFRRFGPKPPVAAHA